MIKINMDMPMTCAQCRFYDAINYYDMWCHAKDSEIYANSYVERDIDCPLIEEEGIKMQIEEVRKLIDRYGECITLGQLLIKMQGNKIYECPKCKGNGFVTIEYNGYPTNLPDSGYAYEPAYKDEKCDLCNGEGYTEHEYKPRMVQDGWE